MVKGFIMLNKELMDSEDYFSERFTRMQAYIDMCLLASFKERKFVKRGQIIELKAGQFAKSEEELAERWKWSRNTVRKYLNEQQRIGNIEQQKSRLITITTVKFGLIIEQQVEQQKGAFSEQQIEQQNEQQQEYIYNKEKIINKEELANASKKKEIESLELQLFPEQVKAEPTEKMKIATFNYSEFRDFFNNAMKEHGSRISAVRKIDERRKNVLHARMMDYGIDSLYEVVEKVVNSKFLNGGSKTGWRADFDWIFGPDNFRKIIEGKYDDREDTPVLPEEQTSDINWQS